MPAHKALELQPSFDVIACTFAINFDPMLRLRQTQDCLFAIC
jgi:hypothetical protein